MIENVKFVLGTLFVNIVELRLFWNTERRRLLKMKDYFYEAMLMVLMKTLETMTLYLDDKIEENEQFLVELRDL